MLNLRFWQILLKNIKIFFFVVKLSAMLCICYECEISWGKILGYTVIIMHLH